MSVTRLEEVLIKVCIPKIIDKALHMFNSQGVKDFVDVKRNQGNLTSFSADP